MYHWCFWIEGTDDSKMASVLPVGLSYADAKQILVDQARANRQEEETVWVLGSIWCDAETFNTISYASPIWRLHVPARGED